MAEHTKAFEQVKNQIINAKNGKVNLITPEPINHEQAVEIFRGLLHKLVNDAYLSDDGITEDESDQLHNIIEGGDPNV